MCGDSTMIDDVERLMNGEKADMVFTSPPYNGNTVSIEGKFGNCVNPTLYKNNNSDNKTSDEYLSFNQEIFSCINIATKENAVVFYNINYNKKSPSEYIKIISNTLDLFSLQETIVWVKKMAISLAGDNLTRIYEFIFMLKKGEGLPFSKGHHDCIKNLWEISNINANTKEHKACFPVELPEKAINLVNCEVLFEPFCGSGSTLIACEKTNRKCYGMELDEHYCDVIINRWQNFTGKKATLELTGQTYEELKAERDLTNNPKTVQY